MNEPQPKPNMIEQTKSYKVGDKIFPTLKEAQTAALLSFLIESQPILAGKDIDETNMQECMIETIVTMKDDVIAILAMSEPAPKARKPRSDQGKPHRRKKAVAANPEPTPIESTVEGSGKYSGK